MSQFRESPAQCQIGDWIYGAIGGTSHNGDANKSVVQVPVPVTRGGFTIGVLQEFVFEKGEIDDFPGTVWIRTA